MTVLIICGATAVGKTNLAINIAKHFNTSIISADSRQCFLEMNIGTAKPSAEELNSVKHYFINSHSIHQKVDAALFEEFALKATQEIFAKQNIAVMVGGTGMYIKAFCDGLDAMPTIPENIKDEVRNGYAKNGIIWLQNAVEKEDPIYFKQGETQNPQRMMRALEMVRSSGKSIVVFQKNNEKKRPFNILKIGLELPREFLTERINIRVDLMQKNGLLYEAKQLFPFKNLNALQTVGYSELFDAIADKCSVDKAFSDIKTHTRQYAKRQMTWFKKDKTIEWFAPNDEEKILNYITQNIAD